MFITLLDCYLFNELKELTMLTYEQLLAQQATSIDVNVTEQLSLAELANNKLDSLYTSIKGITNKDCYEDYYYKSGRIIGLLRHIAQNPKHRQKLFMLTGLNSSIIDLYNSSSGKIPYISKDTNTLIEGEKQNQQLFRQVILITATKLGIVLMPDQLNDITEERFLLRYERALEEAKQQLSQLPNIGNIKYDE